MPEIAEINARLETVEKTVIGHEQRLATSEKIQTAQAAQYIDFVKELVRVDEGVKGVREQARVHSEMNTRAMADIQTLIGKTAFEQQGAIDKIITALGIDTDPKAASSLRDDLALLKDIRVSRRDTVKLVIRSAVGLGVIAILGLLALGFRIALLQGSLPMPAIHP
jgi:hypothetical protein